MNIYFEPVNVNQGNMFYKVKNNENYDGMEEK